MWVEALVIATYVFNMCPTKKLKEVIPFEMWIEDKKNVSHLMIFGFVCYKHVQYAKRKKYKDRSKVILLMGYNSTSAYKIYCPISKKVEFSRDFITRKSETWD